VLTRLFSKSNYFKLILIKMEIGEYKDVDHTSFYCIGQRCTLISYISKFKKQGLGDWQCRHLKPGLSVILRTK
jgi:hypothetical protein